MHIGFLTPEFPHKTINRSGGLGTSIKNLALSLIKEGVEVSVFVYGQKENAYFVENGISFYLIKQKGYKILSWYRYRKYLQNYINEKIKEHKVHIIEAPDWTGGSSFINFDCPLIIRLHGTDAYFCNLEGRKQKLKNRFFEKLALNSADALISVSAFTAEKTKEIFNLDQPIKIIPNSINSEVFIPSEKPIIKNQLLYFGSLIRKKGVLELAHIFNKIIKKKPETKLLLLGKDVIDVFEKKSTLELFLERLNSTAINNITHIPEVDYEEVKDYIATSEVIVLPSFAEALPMSWLEAMAMEKALITSNIGWAQEVMINGKTGFTEDPKNHGAYAEKVVYLMENAEESKKMGKAAREQVLKKFSTGVVVKRNIKFYKDCF